MFVEPRGRQVDSTRIIQPRRYRGETVLGIIAQGMDVRLYSLCKGKPGRDFKQRGNMISFFVLKKDHWI